MDQDKDQDQNQEKEDANVNSEEASDFAEVLELIQEDSNESDDEKTEATEGSEGPAEVEQEAEVFEVEFLEAERAQSIIESILFASSRPVSLGTFKQTFKGTNIKTDKIKRALEALQVEYAGACRGVTLEEVSSGYQLRTKFDNVDFMKRTQKGRAFRLSGPALEVLSIVAYKQPIIKSEVDEIRGVESGHLLRALMEKGLVNFDGKSELPGKPMQYGTGRKFLEIFNLRNLRELPSLSEIDELIPEGIGEEEDKTTLSELTDKLSETTVVDTYSQGEEELEKISGQLAEIDTSSEFFEQEKQRQKAKREAEKAQDLRDALAVGEELSTRDARWLERYDAKLEEEKNAASVAAETNPENISTDELEGEANLANTDGTPIEESVVLEQAVESFETDTDEPIDIDGVTPAEKVMEVASEDSDETPPLSEDAEIISAEESGLKDDVNEEMDL